VYHGCGICPFLCEPSGDNCFTEFATLSKFFRDKENIVRQFAQYTKVEKRMRAYDCRGLYNKFVEAERNSDHDDMGAG